MGDGLRCLADPAKNTGWLPLRLPVGRFGQKIVGGQRANATYRSSVENPKTKMPT